MTSNRPFAEWHEVFPNAACVVSLIDRLVHLAEVISIEGESYRLKEARERADKRARQRGPGKSAKEANRHESRAIALRSHARLELRRA